MHGAALIWCPFANEASAARAAETLLDEGLIACANLLPQMRAFYVWNGERGEARECVALFKTRADLLANAVARLESIHPYDSPAITAWTCDAAGAKTLDWLASLPSPD